MEFKRKVYNLRIISLNVLCAILVSSPVSGRNKDDQCSWLTADLVLQHTNKWSYVISLEERLHENISRSQLFSTAFHVRYKLTPKLQLTGAYEFFGSTPGSDIIMEHRIMVQSDYSFSSGNWKFNNRLSFLNDFERWKNSNWQIRNRFRINYQLQKFSPYISSEIYCKCNDFNLKLYKMRYASGLSYELNNKNNFSFYYMLEDYDTKPLRQHIIGIGYTHAIKL